MGDGIYTSLIELTRLRHDARHLHLGHRHPLTSVWQGRKSSRLRGRGLDFEEIRHYQPGDDVRHIDWRLTRRTGRPFVRVYTEERDRPVWLVVDQGPTMFFGSQLLMKSVAAAHAAALLAWSTIAAGDRVGGVIVSGARYRCQQPSRRSAHLVGWLDQLATASRSLSTEEQAQQNPPTLESALQQLACQVRHDSLVIVISDFSDIGPGLPAALTAFRPHNEVLCFHVSDPMEHSVAAACGLVVSDGQRQLAVGDGAPDVFERYASAYRDHTDQLKSMLEHRGAPLLNIDCARPVGPQLQLLLTHRVDHRSRSRV